MNAESFSQFIKNLSQLYQVPPEELRSLALEHPYCQNLHRLILEQDRLEHRESKPQDIRRANVYSTDRGHLFFQLKALNNRPRPSREDSFILEEDHLELKDLKEAQQALQPLAPTPVQVVSRQPPRPLHALQPPFEKDAPELQLDALDALLQDMDQEEAERLAQIEKWERQSMDLVIDQICAISQAVESLSFSNSAEKVKEEDLPTSSIQPRPKTSFTSWVQQFQPENIRRQLNEIMEAGKAYQVGKTYSNDSDVIPEIADRSVQDNEEMASETLAQLLVAQMQYEKAAEVYQRLMLLFPEKKAFFAQKIQSIQKLLA